jgi:hypothetical protein
MQPIKQTSLKRSVPAKGNIPPHVMLVHAGFTVGTAANNEN